MAGPTTQEDKPVGLVHVGLVHVGLVHVGLAGPDDVSTHELRLDGERAEIGDVPARRRS